jgi:histidyl-tRNA synthetase
MVLRGLDYYTGTVFEMYDISPENNRAMFGGGRYDNLVGLFGNHKLSGVGLGWGDVTLKNFLETHGLLPKFDGAVDVFVTLPKMEYRSKAEEIVRALRSQGLKVSTPLSADGFGAQLKLANKHGARVAVLLGDTELAQGQVVVKNLQKGEQTTLPITGLAEKIAEILK